VFGILSGNHSAMPMENRKQIPGHPKNLRLAEKSDFSCWTYGLATQQIQKFWPITSFINLKMAHEFLEFKAKLVNHKLCKLILFSIQITHISMAFLIQITVYSIIIFVPLCLA